MSTNKFNSLKSVVKSGDNTKVASPFQPKETVNPQTFTAVTLDDISVKLSKLIELDTIKLGMEKKRYDVETKILKELEDRRDHGKELPQSGTVSSTDFTFIDIGQLRQGQRAKSFELVNDDLVNDLYFGWNTTQAGLQPDLNDPLTPLSKFRILQPGENIKVRNNVDVIENVALLGRGGNATFRLWLTW